MKFVTRVKKSSFSIDRGLSTLVLILIFMSSYFDIIYERATVLNVIYNRLYRYSIYALVVICLVKIFLDIMRGRGLNQTVCGMILMFFYVAFITFAMDLFSINSIVVDNLSWILSFCVFFMYGEKQQEETLAFKRIVLIGTAIYCVLMLPNLRSRMMGLDPKGGIISPLYYGMGFLGIILLCCSNKMKIIFSGVIGLMILFSTKRTGLFSFILGLLGYLYINAVIEGQVRERLKKYGSIIFILVVAMLISFFSIERFNINILGRLATLSTDGGSGRSIIWESIINRFKESDTIHKLLGYGFHAVPEIIRPFNRYLFAHNGFMEVLFDFGIVGLTGMIAGILWLLTGTIRMIKWKAVFAPVMVYAMSIVVLFSIFSYLFEEARVVMPVTVICGICLGRFKRMKGTVKHGGIQKSTLSIPNLDSWKTY